MSDVWTSVGVVIGISIAVLTGLEWLDPIIAMAVGLKIGWEGLQIFRRSSRGLMDTAISPQESAVIEAVLHADCQDGIEWHALRTRQSGVRRFVSVHILVPGGWTIQQGHDLVERIETDIRSQINQCSVFTHLEPIEDPLAFEDQSLVRQD